MWHVASVEAEDFLGYEKLKLTFDPLTGITLIVGNRGAGRSNGAGKSTLFHAISYGMYGRLTKRLDPIEKVIRRGADACRVRVTLVDGAGTVVVSRTRKRKGGAAVDTEGFDARSLAAGQQEAIDARLPAALEIVPMLAAGQFERAGQKLHTAPK
jgi:DNA repair exonuclease SbcCD ATPase subunit